MATPIPPRGAAPRRASLALVFLAAATVTTPSAVHGQGLTLRLAPEAQALRWDEGLGLDDATFLGAGLSMGFGRYVTLRGAYVTAGVIPTAFSAAGFGGETLGENDVRSSLFSTSVLFRLGDGRVAPVLATRGGVLYMEPADNEPARQIFGAYGGGLDMRLLPWLDGQILLERMDVRLDRSRLAPAGAVEPDADASVTRHNLALSASLGMRLGAGRGSNRADRVDQGFGDLLAGRTEGLMIPLELQAGVQRFDESVGLGDQRTVAVRSGFDLGPYFGIHGRYWRGVSDGFDAVQGASGWSGEFQFNVGRVTGASPNLILGYGQTRFTDDFRAENDLGTDGFNTLVVGAGLGVPLGDRMRLTVSARDHISTLGALDQAASTSDLRHNVGVSAGVSFLLRGRQADRTPTRGVAETAGDSTDYRSDRVLAIPLPKEGELYVRYGPGGRTLPGEGAGALTGTDSAAVASAVNAELARLVAGGGAALSDSARAALQSSVIQRLAALPEPTPLADTAAAAAAARGGVRPDAGGTEVEQLRRQVEELTRLVREGMLLQAAGGILSGGGTTVNVLEGGGVQGSTSARESEPFLRAVEGRLGFGNMGSGNGGPTLRGEAYMGSLRGDDNLIPFASLEIAHHGIGTEDDGRTVEGSARTLGAGFGVTAVLPRLGPVWPNVGVLFSAAHVATSGDGPEDESAMDDLYGGLTMGPGIQIGAAYRPSLDSRTFFSAAVRKIWSGRTSRWSLEAGVRMVFPPRRGSRVGPFSARQPDVPLAEDSTATPTPDTARSPDTLQAPAQAGPDPATELAARVATLERRLEEQSAARARAETVARAAQARLDSLAAEAAAREQASERARTSLVEALEELAAESPGIRMLPVGDTAVRVVLAGDHFAVGATDVTPEGLGHVQVLGGILAGADVRSVTVEGHTDDTGTEEANLVISRLRAQAVAAVIEEAGVPAAAMDIVGRGESEPVADNDTREGRAQNRRVVVVVTLGG